MTIRVRQTFFGLVLVMVTVAGCTSDSRDSESSPEASPSSAGEAPQAEETPPAFDVFDYQADPQRVARIDDAMQRFGTVVMEQSRLPDSSWGPFDTYCSHKSPNGALEGGYASEGYVPIAGDDCGVQHNPLYGGADIQVAAEVNVEPDGSYASRISDVMISTPDCTVFVRYANDTKVPLVSVGPPPDSKSASFATSHDEAQAIDDQAVTCLDNTRP